MKKFLISILLSLPLIAAETDAAKANKKFQAALSNHERGLLDVAEREYREVLQIQPNYVSAHINLGNLLSDKGKFARAEIHYQTAVKLNPRSEDANYNIGAFYLKRKEYDNAMRYFQRTTSVNPRHKSAWLNLATIYMRYYRHKAEPGLWQSARDALVRASRIDREYPHIYYNFGMLHEMKNEYGIALQYYREALRLYPSNSRNYERTEKRMAYLRTLLK